MKDLRVRKQLLHLCCYRKKTSYVTELSFPNLSQHVVFNPVAYMQGCIRFHVYNPRATETGRFHHSLKFISRHNGDGEQTFTMSCHLCRSFLHYGIHYGLPLPAVYAAYDFHHVHSGICDTCQRPFLSKGTCIAVPVCLHCHVHTWTGLIRSRLVLCQKIVCHICSANCIFCYFCIKTILYTYVTI